MTDCNDMKVGDIYKCPDCGLEVQVIKECDKESECCKSDKPCALKCCDKELIKKQ